ncbi:MAG: hypothetical protein V3U20_06500 [Thermoplasmata archaeon]
MTSMLGKRIVLIVAKRGYTGADREVFFHHIRGIRYIELEKEILSLERMGYITVEWVGPSNFTVSITPEGVELAKSYQEDIWRKSAKALKDLKHAKHAEKSIIHEEVGYSKMIEDKMGVEEVGELSNEIIEELDEQILSERDTSSEEAVPENVGVPAVEEVIENDDVEMEKGVVERRISGELESEATSEGEIIAPSLEYSVEEGGSLKKIAVDKATSLEKRTKERRISGKIEGGVLVAQPKKVKARKHKAHVSEQKEAEAVPSPQEDLSENVLPPDFYQQIEDAIAFGESLVEQADTLPIPTSLEMLCIWEKDRECPVLKGERFGKNTTLTPNHCVMCQLLEIKRLLKE